MFFTKDKRFSKGLTWFYLPFAIWNECTFLFEPLIILYIFSISFIYKDIFTLISACFVSTFYISLNIISEESIHQKTKLKLFLFAPTMYLFFYVLSFVEYVALLKSLFKLHTLGESLKTDSHTWKPVTRIDYSVTL